LRLFRIVFCLLRRNEQLLLQNRLYIVFAHRKKAVQIQLTTIIARKTSAEKHYWEKDGQYKGKIHFIAEMQEQNLREENENMRRGC